MLACGRPGRSRIPLTPRHHSAEMLERPVDIRPVPRPHKGTFRRRRADFRAISLGARLLWTTHEQRQGESGETPPDGFGWHRGGRVLANPPTGAPASECPQLSPALVE